MVRVRARMFNATFNNISAISWRLVLLVEETWVPRENHRPEEWGCPLLLLSFKCFEVCQSSPCRSCRSCGWLYYKMIWCGFIVLNATFNNISVISWRSVLLVEETGGPRENHRPAASHWQTLSHKYKYCIRNVYTTTTEPRPRRPLVVHVVCVVVVVGYIIKWRN